MAPSVLFLSPAVPAFTGNGLAMRAAATLKLLSSWATEIHLLVIPIYPTTEAISPEIEALCKSSQILTNPSEGQKGGQPTSLWQQDLQLAKIVPPPEINCHNERWQYRIEDAIRKLTPELIIVFRFYLGQFVAPEITKAIPTWLDIDELESKLRSRLTQTTGTAIGASEGTAPAAYRTLERRYLPCFSRIFAASDIEAKSVRAACPDVPIFTLPNVYPKDTPQPERKPDGKIRILYVGTFGYEPNRDAISYFCSDVLPLIEQKGSLPVEVDVVGPGLRTSDKKLFPANVKLVGAVPDTTPLYAACDICIVPIRIAGGTRIKILEAFSHERAVVSTSLGAEGLKSVPERDILIGDTAEAFANQCISLIENPDKRIALAKAGHKYFKKHHTIAQLEKLAPKLFGP